MARPGVLPGPRGGLPRVWSALGWWFGRQSQRQDEMGAVELTRRMQSASAPAMLVFGVTLTFAAFDWIMSLDAALVLDDVRRLLLRRRRDRRLLACSSCSPLLLQRGGQLGGVVTVEHFHDLGKLLFGFVVFWAYIALLAVHAHLVRQHARGDRLVRPALDARLAAGSIALAVGHFVVPFFFLLLRDVKRHRAGLVVGRRVDARRALARPLLAGDAGHYTEGPRLHCSALYQLARHRRPASSPPSPGRCGERALVPVTDPRLAESLAFENV